MSDGKAGRDDTRNLDTLWRIGGDLLSLDFPRLDDAGKFSGENFHLREARDLLIDYYCKHRRPEFGEDGAVLREALYTLVTAHGDALEGDSDARGLAAAQLLAEGLGMRLCPLDNWGRAPDSEVDDERRAILRRAEEGR